MLLQTYNSVHIYKYIYIFINLQYNLCKFLISQHPHSIFYTVYPFVKITEINTFLQIYNILLFTLICIFIFFLFSFFIREHLD